MVLYESHDAAQTGPFLFAGIRCVRSSSRVLLSVLKRHAPQAHHSR